MHARNKNIVDCCPASIECLVFRNTIRQNLRLLKIFRTLREEHKLQMSEVIFPVIYFDLRETKWKVLDVVLLGTLLFL
jgi:hypothetical protein